MQIALYIALGLLVLTAVGMQVWMMRSGTQVLPESRRALYVFLRVVNIVLVLGVVAVVIYALAVK